MTDVRDFIAARLDEDEAAALAWPEDQRDWTAAGKRYLSYASGSGEQMGAVNVGGDYYGWERIYIKSDLDGDLAGYLALHDPARALREVQAKRAIMERESTVQLPEWHPDCGGDWVLSGPGFFANYWPDNTVSASITDGFDGPALADSGIVLKESRAACQAFAEEWIREHLPERSATLRAIASAYSDHPDYREEWQP